MRSKILQQIMDGRSLHCLTKVLVTLVSEIRALNYEVKFLSMGYLKNYSRKLVLHYKWIRWYLIYIRALENCAKNNHVFGVSRKSLLLTLFKLEGDGEELRKVSAWTSIPTNAIMSNEAKRFAEVYLTYHLIHPLKVNGFSIFRVL